MSVAERMDAERARMDAAGTTRACPWCFQEVWNSCYHEGVDVSAVEMTKERQQSEYDKIDRCSECGHVRL